MLDKGLRDMLVAEYEPEHNRVGNVKVVKRLDIHWYFPFVLSCGTSYYLTRFFRAFEYQFPENLFLFTKKACVKRD